MGIVRAELQEKLTAARADWGSWPAEKPVVDKTIAKAQWGPGPWMDEPDEACWADPTTGYVCWVVRHYHHGSLCGYVGVEPGHPAWGLEFKSGIIPDFIKAMKVICGIEPGDEDDAELDLRAHGGVTWSGPKADLRIMEPPECTGPDSSVRLFWLFGFDCGHAGDFAPGIDALMKHLDIIAPWSRLHKLPPREEIPLIARDALYPEYRTFEYVMEECRSLAWQLHGLAKLGE